MRGDWKEQAAIIGQTIHDLAGKNRELEPLATAFINFARKYRLEVDSQVIATKSKGADMGVNLKRVRTALAAFDQAGLVVIDKEDYEKLVKAIDRQTEEIEALELRIKRLTERH